MEFLDLLVPNSLKPFIVSFPEEARGAGEVNWSLRKPADETIL